MNAIPRQPGSNTWSILAGGGLIFLLGALGLFTRLGHYALWDDEAGTALTAIGIWRTGDTTALLDHNLVAYDSGKDLRNLHERLMPPLPGYLAAPFIGLLGRTAWAARLPFALCGAVSIGLMVWWALADGRNRETLLFLGLALLTNVSFFLFCRQCRYYAPAMLCSTVVAWIYVHFAGRRWQIALFSAASLCLFASNYLNWAALWFCLALDFLIWRRKSVQLGPIAWVTLIVPQIVIGGAILWIWNPFAILSGAEKYPEAGRLHYLWWCLRDLVTCEFGVPVIVLAGLSMALWEKTESRMQNAEKPSKALGPESWLLRGCVCLVAYVVVLSFLVQRPPSLRGVAAVRYFTPVIPLFIGLSAISLMAVYRHSKWAAIGLALAAFSSNILNGGPLLATGWQCTIGKFARELAAPPGDPYTVAANWIRENLRERESVWVVPDFAAYPLMFHAPAPTYAWQLIWPPAKEEFKSLAPIHFIGQEAPDYIVAFGPATKLAQESIASWNRPEIQYAQVERLGFFWKEMHRPELFWRTFGPISDFDRGSEVIFIFKLKQPKRQ